MFVPLHIKSAYSIGYGTATIEELIDRAAALGYSGLALTDLENLYGQVRFHALCRARGLHAVTGVELRPEFDGKRNLGTRRGRVVLLARDAAGYHCLCRIVSRRRAAREGEGRLGVDPLPLVIDHADGLFVLSDDLVPLERLLASGRVPPEALRLLLLRPSDRAGEGALLAAARRLGIEAVADIDVAFLCESDHRLHVLQVAIREGRQVADVAHGPEVEPPTRWLRAPADAADLFADVPKAVAAAEAIAAQCRFDLTAEQIRFPKVIAAAEADDTLRSRCSEALAASGRSSNAAYAARLDQEMGVFRQLGLIGFVVAVSDIVAFCRGQQIFLAARGSAVGSLVFHLLGTSPVDPVKEGLLFERFLHAGKSGWPDVDLDLPWDRRDEVIAWALRHFGPDRTAMVGSIQTFQPRSALREGLKAYGYDRREIAAVSEGLPPEDLAVEEMDFLDLALSAAPTAEPETAIPALQEKLRAVQRLVGRPHHLATHPGGMVIGGGRLEDAVPLERAPKGLVVTQYDLAGLDALGVVKIDLLGNRCLSEIAETLSVAGRPMQLESIPVGDPGALGLINRADTLGCFQLESPAMRALLARIPIRSQEDVVAALALIRPGAAAGEAKAAFVRRARGEEAAQAFDGAMTDRLADTHGMLLYEEDLMVLLGRFGGLNLAEADEMRAAIIRSCGDLQALARLEREFLHHARHAAGDAPGAEDRAARAWALAARFAAYSFNKAHAISYARLAYFAAYLKVHFPQEFACAVLNHHQGMYPLRTLAAEMARRGITLLGPDVNVSAVACRLEQDRVRIGLGKLKTLSARSTQEILRKRTCDGPFTSVRDLLERVRLSSRERSALVLSGSCDALPPLSADQYPFAHEAVLDTCARGKPLAAIEDVAVVRPPLPIKELQRLELYQKLVRVRNELRYLDMHISAHPIGLLRKEADRYGCVRIRDAAAAANVEARIAATIAAMRRVATRRGVMQFLTLEDETGLLETAVLPDAFARLGNRVVTPGPFLVDGRIVREDGAVHLDVLGLSPFHERERPFGRDIR